MAHQLKMSWFGCRTSCFGVNSTKFWRSDASRDFWAFWNWKHFLMFTLDLILLDLQQEQERNLSRQLHCEDRIKRSRWPGGCMSMSLWKLCTGIHPSLQQDSQRITCLNVMGWTTLPEQLHVEMRIIALRMLKKLCLIYSNQPDIHRYPDDRFWAFIAVHHSPRAHTMYQIHRNKASSLWQGKSLPWTI